MNFDIRKRHTLMVSFVAAHHGSSVAETSTPWLLQDQEKIKTTFVCISLRLKTSKRNFRILARLCYAYLKNRNHTLTMKETCLQLLASERAQSCLCSIEISDTYIYIYLITLILRNITSQLQCISTSAAGTSAIPVTDE